MCFSSFPSDVTYVKYFNCSTARGCPQKKTVTFDHHDNWVSEVLSGKPHTCTPLYKCELPLDKKVRAKLEKDLENATPIQTVSFLFLFLPTIQDLFCCYSFFVIIFLFIFCSFNDL